MNLYGYADGNPIGRLDPDGKDWLNGLSDFSAGFGHVATFGPIDKCYNDNGLTDTYNPNSVLYGGGGVRALVAQTVVSDGLISQGKVYIRRAHYFLRAGRAAANLGRVGEAAVLGNRARGPAFQAAGLRARGLAENGAVRVQGIGRGGRLCTALPDAVTPHGIIEFKNVKCLANSDQLRAMLNSGRQLRLIVNMQTKLSRPLENLIYLTGGTVERFNAVGGGFHPYP